MNPASTFRIIPARAGFTGDITVQDYDHEDHPRSRGVYRGFFFTHVMPCGSSPLARGLRPSGPWRPSGPRIIPARAGFTAMGEATDWLVGDHPRSRGVYLHSAGRSVGGGGSSPLARGLPARIPERLSAFRIIPARAGFTRRGNFIMSLQEDHPRSRGVYVRRVDRDAEQLGSSPLARGLRRDALSAACTRGIIPARAGFTVDCV